MILQKFDRVKHKYNERRGVIVALDERYAQVRWQLSERVTRVQRSYLVYDGKLAWADWMDQYR